MANSAVLLAPHNDDETLWTFYNLDRYKAHVIVILRSFVQAERGGPSFTMRELETDCAMNVIGATWEQWAFPDTNPDWAAIEKRFAPILADHDVVIAPAFEEGGHEHHNAVARIAERLHPDGLIQYLTYVRGEGRSRGGVEVKPTLFEREQKRLALLCYESQVDFELTRPWFGSDQSERIVG